MDREYMRNLIKKNVLVVSEVSDMLGVSKQQINNLIKKNKLLPVKETPNGYLFLRDDIYDYSQQKIKLNLQKPKEIFGKGITNRAKEFFDKSIADYDRIQNINIYFDRNSAIFDGYYTQAECFQKDTLIRIDTPTFVITYDDEKEIWLDGLNCGYTGEGPRGSHDVLVKIGIPSKDANMVYQSKWLSYYREEDGWKVINKNRSNEYENKEWSERWIEERELGSYICLFNNHLVLLQEKVNTFHRDTKPIDFLLKYSFFVPQPVSVTFMTRKMARDTGHYLSSSLNIAFYQIIIKDVTGNELWLDYFLDENVPISKQQNLKDILDNIGIRISKENSDNLTERIKKWLSIEPRIIDKVTYTIKDD